MKRYIKAIIVGLVCSNLSACYDLDRYPDDQVSAGIFWKTEAQVKQAVMGVYAQMKHNEVFGYVTHFDCISDIGMGYDAGYNEILNGTFTASGPSSVLEKWKNLYDGVARANLVLQNIDKATLSDRSKREMQGEVYFMRALYYNELLRFYGAVPLYDESVVISDAYSNMKLPRTSADSIRAFIIADLTRAVDDRLPIKWSAANYGRATKGAAYALRGKVYLYNKEYAKASLDFEEVLKVAYGYSLLANYPDLFTPKGDQSDEIIFGIQNAGGIGNDYGMPFGLHMGSRSAFGSCWNNVMPSAQLVDMYENKDGSMFNWDNYFPGFNASDSIKKSILLSELAPNNTLLRITPHKDELLAIYANRDPRLGQNIILPYTQFLGWLSNKPNLCEFIIEKSGSPHESNQMIRINRAENAAARPYLFRKFVPVANMDGLITNREHTPINYPIIRLADVYLMLAECYNETNREFLAVDYINLVRARSGMPGINSGPAFLVATDKNAIFDRIFRERAFELAGEGHRYHDLRRWGLAEKYLHNNMMYDMIGVSFKKRQFTKRDYLWPVPQSEIDLNPALLPNNEGW